MNIFKYLEKKLVSADKNEMENTTARTSSENDAKKNTETMNKKSSGTKSAKKKTVKKKAAKKATKKKVAKKVAKKEAKKSAKKSGSKKKDTKASAKKDTKKSTTTKKSAKTNTKKISPVSSGASQSSKSSTSSKKNEGTKVAINNKTKPARVKTNKNTSKTQKLTLIHAGDDTSFWINQGPVLTNLLDLHDALENISEEQYGHHARNELDNDFARWVDEVLCDGTCAIDLKNAKDRKKARDVVAARLRVYSW